MTLSPTVEVDYLSARRLHDNRPWRSATTTALRNTAVQWAAAFAQPLLPAWDEEWLAPIREHWTNCRVRALEDLSAACLEAGELDLAVEIADIAAAADPWREAPRRLALEAMLRCGEIATAHLRYERFEQLLDDELGIRPSPAMAALLRARPAALSTAA
ncbi:AfsR/SARP family transcriptional regulator [Kitasatospora sp. LaBMicrA B282]|uniref:AfsR/SARP family transcriptional regulator n=1 Tax=Kitasatospora sp. LaBMicrA B282 TaxID=3420949 RepID=UPI003D0CEAA3